MKVEKGQKAKADPKLTGLNDWVEGTVIDVENNPFKGLVVAIKDQMGRIFFGEEKYFQFFNKILRPLGLTTRSWAVARSFLSDKKTPCYIFNDSRKNVKTRLLNDVFIRIFVHYSVLQNLK